MIDRPNIQGFVVRGYRLPFAAYVYLRIDDAAKARAALDDFLPQVITAEHWTDKPESGINVAFSFAGLKAIGVGERTLDAFPAEFKAGMAARAQRARRHRRQRARQLGGAVPHRRGPRARHGQRQVAGGARGPQRPRARGGRARRRSDRGRRRSSARALEGGREHFGYADGFAQPSIEGSGFDPQPGAGAPEKDGWRPLKPGELLLGYPDEQGAVTPAPPPDDFGVNGSFLVYRKLRQDVAGVPAAAARGGRRVPGRRGAAGRQDRRPLARRHAARRLAGPPGPGAGRRPGAQQRVRLRAATMPACAARSARTCGG